MVYSFVNSHCRRNKVAPMDNKMPQPTAAIFHTFPVEKDSQTGSNGSTATIPSVQRKKGGAPIVRENGLSYYATLLNFVKSLVGAGYLSLPLAFRDAGIWMGLALVVMFAFLNWVCMRQLVKCAQHHYRRMGISYLNYGDVARETCAVSFRWIRAYREWAKNLVNAGTICLQFGFCSSYYLFIAVSLKEIFTELTSFHHSLMHWLLIIYFPMMLLNFIRSLRFIAVFSAVGNVLMVISLVFTLNYLILHPQHSVSELPFYNNFDGALTAAGAIIYSFEAQTLVLPMENKLARPQQMLGPFGILSAGISVASLIYGSMGFFGYLAYGKDVQGSITLNLPQHHLSFTLVKLGICLSVFACFQLQMYVIVEMLWSRVQQLLFAGVEDGGPPGSKAEEAQCRKEGDANGWRLPNSLELGCELFFRTLMVTVCFVFAAAVPNLEHIIPLVGISSGMLLSFVFPALIDLLLFVPLFIERRQNGRAALRLVMNLGLACVGLFGMVAGLRANIVSMLNDGNGMALEVRRPFGLANATAVLHNGTMSH